MFNTFCILHTAQPKLFPDLCTYFSRRNSFYNLIVCFVETPQNRCPTNDQKLLPDFRVDFEFNLVLRKFSFKTRAEGSRVTKHSSYARELTVKRQKVTRIADFMVK